MRNWNNKYKELVQCVKEHALKIKYVSMDFRYEVVGDVSRLHPSSLARSFYHLVKFDDPFVPILLEIREWDEKTQIIDYRVECYVFVSPIEFRFSEYACKNSSYGDDILIPSSLDKTDPFFRGKTPGFEIFGPDESWKVGKVYAFEATTKESNLDEFWKWYSQVPKTGNETHDEWLGRCFNYLNPGMFFYSGNFRKDDYLDIWFEKWVWEGERSPLMEVDLSGRAWEERGSPEFKQWALGVEPELIKAQKEIEKQRELELVRQYKEKQKTT